MPRSEIGNERWDAFCRESSDAWFRHRSTWIDYSLAMRGPGGSEDLSFCVTDSGKLVAVAPLIREAIHQRPDLTEFGFVGWNVPFPALATDLGERHRDKLIKEIFQEIDRLARVHKIAYAAFEVNPLVQLRERHICSANPLPFLGFSSADIATHIVDLGADEETLLRNMRKGHKSDIAAVRRTGLKVDVFDEGSITEEAFAAYRQIHFHAAGRQTRPERTWELMREWVSTGFAMLGLARHTGGSPVAAALTLRDKDGAYYGSSCVEPSLAEERGIMHVLLWETMLALKRAGIRWFETGWQHTPTISQEVPSRKEASISLFKRGFGGVHVHYFRGERFYREDYLRETVLHRADAYCREWMSPHTPEDRQEP